MVNQWLAQYEGKELELFRNYGNPYETISIRVQIDEGCMYLGDDEMEHGPDYGRSLKIYTFDKENTRKAFELLHGGAYDPIQVLKGMLNERHRTRLFIDLCTEHNIAFDVKYYM